MVFDMSIIYEVFISVRVPFSTFLSFYYPTVLRVFDCTCSVFKRFRELNYCQMETKIAVMLEIWETLWLMTRVLLKDH